LRRSTASGALAALALALACGGGSDEPRYPTQDWSGTYLTKVTRSSTDCSGADYPPVMPGFQLVVNQFPNNRATAVMGPIIKLTGDFTGDELDVRQVVQEDIPLPDSLLQRATAADSLETITYRLTASFDGDGYTGEYLVRTPDLPALVRKEKKRRCEYRYELEGTRYEPGGSSKE